MSLHFENRFTTELAADPIEDNYRRQVADGFFSRVQPVSPPAPGLVAFSQEMVDELGIGDWVSSDDAGNPTASQEFVEAFSGRRTLDGMDPHAMVYGGHQFGNWAGQLGDGRAMGLGEVVTPGGEHLTLQLKGAGPTPFSRSADGMAVLRSSVREFLCSEAMFHLGVPTTRALSLILTGDKVMRDMLYDGNPAPEPGAVVCRVAPTFIRFGNFELLASRGDVDGLRALADFTIRHYYPHLLEQHTDTEAGNESIYAAWYQEIVDRTAAMTIEWMRVGFVHGVMNTDNMSILGQTIDYGPYGWLEDYDPSWTPNTTDAQHRRYRFGQQPAIGQWNLAQLGNALVPLFDDIEPLQNALSGYSDTFTSGYREMMSAKLGLDAHTRTDDDDIADLDQLIGDLTELLTKVETDMTIFFRRLAEVPGRTQSSSDSELVAFIADAYYDATAVPTEVEAAMANWIRRYQDELASDGLSDQERKAAMDAVNPLYVMRNYLAQLAIDEAESGDFEMVWELLDVMRNPYVEQSGKERFAAKRPDWARTRVGCSQLSCSS